MLIFKKKVLNNDLFYFEIKFSSSLDTLFLQNNIIGINNNPKLFHLINKNELLHISMSGLIHFSCCRLTSNLSAKKMHRDETSLTIDPISYFSQLNQIFCFLLKSKLNSY